MPQLIFVHGVSTRDTRDYRKTVADRDKLFRELVFTGKDVDIQSPMWGGIIPNIPSTVFETNQGVASFALNVTPLAGFGAGLTGGANVGLASNLSIVGVGQQDPVAALDAICSEIADRALSQQRSLADEELQAFRKAAEFIATDSASRAFAGDATIQSVADRLKEGAPTAFSIGGRINDAISAVTDRVRNAASTFGFGAVRRSISPAVGLFMGDVFVYLKQGTYRNDIQAVIARALVTAHESKKAGKGPVVVIGHSMGGVILVDMLNDPSAAGLPRDIEVDALLTVGSQPGLFGALDVLAHNAPANSPRRKPDSIGRWLNVFDPIDPLAFRTDMIFKGVEDLAFNSVAGLTETHSKYFQRPQFYARSRVWLQKYGIL